MPTPTAANAFLAGGLEPAAARQRYQADITQAAIRIEAASALVGSSAARTQMPGHLTKQASTAARPSATTWPPCPAQLPVYTDEVGTARADNRLGLPLGAAYLREASALLRGTLLPARQRHLRQGKRAADLGERAGDRAAAHRGRGAWSAWASATCSTARRGGWPGTPTGWSTTGCCWPPWSAWSRWCGWPAAFARAAGPTCCTPSSRAPRPAQAFARADVAALQAHADESLTLIDNSGDDSYQQDFLAQKKLLGPGPGTLLAAVQSSAGNGGVRRWPTPRPGTALTLRLRKLDDGGNHAAAVKSALTGDAATKFALLSATLSDGIDAHQAVFASSARGGRDAFTGLARGHDRGVAGNGGRLRLGTEPPARGVPVNTRPRLAGRHGGSGHVRCCSVLAASVLVLGAAVADAAPGQPPAIRAGQHRESRKRGQPPRMRPRVIRTRAACGRPARRR